MNAFLAQIDIGPKNRGKLRRSGRVGNSCSTSDTRLVNLVTNPVIIHERGKDRKVFTTSGTYPWLFVTQIFHNGQPRDGDRKKTVKIKISVFRVLAVFRRSR